MSTLLASDRLGSLQRNLAVAITAQVVDSWAIGRGIIVGVVGGDGGCAGGWGLVCGGHFDFSAIGRGLRVVEVEFVVKLMVER